MKTFFIFVVEEKFVEKTQLREEIPFHKIQVNTNTTVLDVIKQCKGNLFDPFELGYILKRTQINESPIEKIHQYNNDILNQYYQQRIQDLDIVNNEVLILHAAYSPITMWFQDSIDFPPTIGEFDRMVQLCESNKMYSSHHSPILYMALLYTDSDEEIASFIRKAYSDIDACSRYNIQVYAIEKINTGKNLKEVLRYWKYLLSEKLYIISSLLNRLGTKPYKKTQCYEIGKKLGIEYGKFPCAALFDIPIPERVYILPIKPCIKFFRHLFDNLNETIEEFEKNGKGTLYDAIKRKYEIIIQKLEANSSVENKDQKMTEKESPRYDLSGAKIYGFAPDAKNINLVSGETVENNTITQHNYAPEKQDLATAAKEIQQLLAQLSETYPTTTLVEQAVVAEKAIEQIEDNPTLKQRVIKALKAGTIEALMEIIDNPVVNVMRAALEAWQESE